MAHYTNMVNMGIGVENNRKRPFSLEQDDEDVNLSLLSRSLSCLFTARASVKDIEKENYREATQEHGASAPPKKRRFATSTPPSWTNTHESPSLCSVSSLRSTASASSSIFSAPLPTTISTDGQVCSLKNHRKSRSIGKLSLNDSLCSLASEPSSSSSSPQEVVDDEDAAAPQRCHHQRASTATSIVSDCSSRDLLLDDTTGHGESYRRLDDDDDDSLSYSDDSASSDGLNDYESYGWYTDGQDNDDDNDDEGGVFF